MFKGLQFGQAWVDTFTQVLGQGDSDAFLRHGVGVKGAVYKKWADRWKEEGKRTPAATFVSQHVEEIMAEASGTPRCPECGTEKGLHATYCSIGQGARTDSLDDDNADQMAGFIEQAIEQGRGWELARFCEQFGRDGFEALDIMRQSRGWNIRANDGFRETKRQLMAITLRFDAGADDYGRYPVSPPDQPEGDSYDLAGADSSIAEIAATILADDEQPPLEISPDDFATVVKAGEALFFLGIVGDSGFFELVDSLNAAPVGKGCHDAMRILSIVERSPHLSEPRLAAIRELTESRIRAANS